MCVTDVAASRKEFCDAAAEDVFGGYVWWMNLVQASYLPDRWYLDHIGGGSRVEGDVLIFICVHNLCSNVEPAYRFTRYRRHTKMTNIQVLTSIYMKK